MAGAVSPVHRNGRLGSAPTANSPTANALRRKMTPSAISPLSNLPVRQAELRDAREYQQQGPMELTGPLRLGQYGEQVPGPIRNTNSPTRMRSPPPSYDIRMQNPFGTNNNSGTNIRNSRSPNRSQSPGSPQRGRSPKLQTQPGTTPVKNSDRYTFSQVESGKDAGMKSKLRTQQNEINSLKTALQNLWQQTQRSPLLTGISEITPCGTTWSEASDGRPLIRASEPVGRRSRSTSPRPSHPRAPPKGGQFSPAPERPKPWDRVTWADVSTKQNSRSRSPQKGDRNQSPHQDNPRFRQSPAYSFARHEYSPPKRWQSEATTLDRHRISPSHRRATSRAAIHSSGRYFFKQKHLERFTFSIGHIFMILYFSNRLRFRSTSF